jgi:thioredoxin-related protein
MNPNFSKADNIIRILIIVLSLSVIIGGLVVFLIQTNILSLPDNILSSLQSSSSSQKSITGTYSELSNSSISSLDKYQILFFYGDNCPACDQLDKDIKANLEKIPSDVAINKIKYGQDKELEEKYNIKGDSSFVLLDKNSTLIVVNRGITTLEGVENLVKYYRNYNPSQYPSKEKTVSSMSSADSSSIQAE